MIMKLCMEQYVLKLYKGYINDDPELTLTHLKTMSNLAKLHKVKMVKTLKNLLQNQMSYDLETWHVASVTQALQRLYK